MFEVQHSSWPLSVLFISSLLVASLGLTTPSAQAQSSITGERVSCENRQANRYPCKNVDLMSYLSISALGGESGVSINDVWGWTDPKTGRRYALVGRTDGTAFVDVTNPTEPIYLGELPSHSGSSTWRDVKVFDNHAFIVSEASDHGMQVFDLTQLRSVSNVPVTFSETAHYDRFSTAHNVVVNRESGYAYVVGIQGRQDVPSSADCGAGLHMVDVQSPDQPAFAGCHNDLSTGGQVAPGYTHDAQCVIYRGPDDDYRGNELCFNANENQVNIADVTNKTNTETIANATYPQPGYVHQAWLTEDQRYLLVDDETDEMQGKTDSTRTLVFDVSDLDNPVLTTIYKGTTRSSDHNQYVVGNYSYQANYEGGLRILDVSDPENPGEVAYFDTYPSSTQAGFNGAWSTYPFFDNGMVLVSSIGEGLFVLNPKVSPILSPRVKANEQTAFLRWKISSTVQTKQLVVERRLSDSQGWRTEAKNLRSSSARGTKTYEYKATGLQPGKHQFRVRHVSRDGTESISRPKSVQILPKDPIVLNGLPNPVQGEESFTVFLRETQDLRIDLYDTLGRRVTRVHSGSIQAGFGRRLSIPRLSSGIYFLRIRGESVRQLQKIVVTR